MARGFATHTSRMFIKAWKALNYNRIEEEVVSKSLSGPLECSGSLASTRIRGLGTAHASHGAVADHPSCTPSFS